jgi:hypothetical protein
LTTTHIAAFSATFGPNGASSHIIFSRLLKKDRANDDQRNAYRPRFDSFE